MRGLVRSACRRRRRQGAIARLAGERHVERTVVRLLPPLTVTEEEVNEAVTRPRCRDDRRGGEHPVDRHRSRAVAAAPGGDTRLVVHRADGQACGRSPPSTRWSRGKSPPRPVALLPPDRVTGDRAAHAERCPGHPRRRGRDGLRAEPGAAQRKVAEVRSLVPGREPARSGVSGVCSIEQL